MYTLKTTSAPSKLVSLYTLVDELLSSNNYVNKDSGRIFSNEIPRHLSVSTTRDFSNPLLGELITTISSAESKNYIRISAAKINGEVKLFIKKTIIKGFSFSGIRMNKRA